MPSPPPILSSKVICYYADTTYWDTKNLYHNEVEVEIIDEHVLCNQGKLIFFIKLPIERVRKRSTPFDENVLRLGKKS